MPFGLVGGIIGTFSLIAVVIELDYEFGFLVRNPISVIVHWKRFDFLCGTRWTGDFLWLYEMVWKAAEYPASTDWISCRLMDSGGETRMSFLNSGFGRKILFCGWGSWRSAEESTCKNGGNLIFAVLQASNPCT